VKVLEELAPFRSEVEVFPGFSARFGRLALEHNATAAPHNIPQLNAARAQLAVLVLGLSAREAISGDLQPVATAKEGCP